MSVDYRDLLLNMLTALTLEGMITDGLNALNQLVKPCAGALLLWDVDLKRYLIGDVLITNGIWQPAQFRREVLRVGNLAYHENPYHFRLIENNIFYLPLNTPDAKPIGAYLYQENDHAKSTVTPDAYIQLARVTTRSLWTLTRIERADREHTELEAEHERLEHLLGAVEQQQMTIDRLLTLERQFSTSLETKVEERTQALHEAQVRLLQSEKLAVIGQLAGSLAHEINNPLQAIQSGLDLAISELETGQTAQVKDDLMVIQTELERIQTIFKQMLDFNRPITSIYQPLDINAICEGVRVLMRKKLQEIHVELKMDLDLTVSQTCGDSNQIKQVLINLVLNAAEAMSKSGGQIMLQTQSVPNRAFVRVIDNGVGVTPDDLPRLFEPLFTTKTRGLGLGLAISREIIERHNGQITVVSTLGSGTTFTVSLPQQEKCDDAPYTPAYR